MNQPTLGDLQESVQDKLAFKSLDDYFTITLAFLDLIARIPPTRIISPSSPNYIFYQYSEDYQHRITRPLNGDLFIESARTFKRSFERFVLFLADLRQYQAKILAQGKVRQYVESKEINKIIYTLQQAIGSIADSFDNQNQSRKRAGQLFENLVKLPIQQVGLVCEPRTVVLPIPGYPDKGE